MLFAIITTIASTPLRREGRYFKNKKMDIVFLFFIKTVASLGSPTFLTTVPLFVLRKHLIFPRNGDILLNGNKMEPFLKSTYKCEMSKFKELNSTPLRAPSPALLERIYGASTKRRLDTSRNIHRTWLAV